MQPYLPYVWLAVVIAAVVFEAATPALISIWFIPSGLIALLLAILNVPFWIQAVTFAVLSAALLLFCRPIFKKFFRTKTEPTNADALIGQRAIVTKRIDNLAQTGAAKLEGKEWTARSEEDALCFEEGELVSIRRIEGVKLICGTADRPNEEK